MWVPVDSGVGRWPDSLAGLSALRGGPERNGAAYRRFGVWRRLAPASLPIPGQDPNPGWVRRE